MNEITNVLKNSLSSIAVGFAEAALCGLVAGAIVAVIVRMILKAVSKKKEIPSATIGKITSKLFGIVTVLTMMFVYIKVIAPGM